MVSVPAVKHSYRRVQISPGGRDSVCDVFPCVSRVAWWFSAWKSTVLRGLPFFLAQMTMRWHHLTGSPTGTGSRMPNSTSRSRPALTSSCQWRGDWDRVVMCYRNSRQGSP